LIAASYVFLVLFMASCIFLGLLATRINAGKPTFGAEKIRFTICAFLTQLFLFVLSTPAVYHNTGGRLMFSMVILFAIFVLGVPAALASYYYVTFIGGWFARSIYMPDVKLPGTEIPETDHARGLAVRGDLDGAAALLAEFLEKKPDSLPGLQLLASLQLRREKFAEATDLCRRALEADAAIRATKTGLVEESRVDLVTLLADALERAGRRTEAAEAVEREAQSLKGDHYRRILAQRAARLRAAV
jgi:tetratricopeptide (TPR) repeat protein